MYMDKVIGTLLDTNPFYSPFISISKFIETTEGVAAIGWNGANLLVYVNSTLFETYTLIVGRGILKHEYAHMILRHLSSSRQLKLEVMVASKFPTRLDLIHPITNIVEDIEINGGVVPLNELPVWVQHAGLYNLPYGLLAEEYLKLIPPEKLVAAAEANIPDIKQVEYLDDIDDLLLDEKIKEARRRGDISEGLERLLEKLQPPSIDWKRFFRFELLTVVRSKSTIPTFSRSNRRFPDFSGVLYKTLPECFVFHDTSGSITDKNLVVLASEIYGLKRYFSDITVFVIDSAIQKIYRFKKTIESVKGGGGSNFIPAFEEVFSKPHRRPPVIILLTDGDISVPEIKPAADIFWVLCKGDRKVPYGKKIILN